MLRNLQRASPHWHRNRSRGNTGTGGGHQLLCHGLQRQPRSYSYSSFFYLWPIPSHSAQWIVVSLWLSVSADEMEHWPRSTSCSSFLWSVPGRNGATNAIMAIKSDDDDDDRTFRRWIRGECARYLNVSSQKGRWILAEKIWAMATPVAIVGCFFGRRGSALWSESRAR